MAQAPLLQIKLAGSPSWFVTAYAALCSFGVYFCMYAFRKPFTAAGFAGMQFLHVDYKVWLVAAQVMGYMLSKFYGIRFISSMQAQNRAATILKLICVSWVALLLFAIVPAPYSIAFLFINGFPLGMIWGIVFSYLEGRKSTELMGAVLCASFIFSSGVVKSIGKSMILYWHVTETWMPFVTGALFVFPLVLFTALLDQIPPPAAEDIQSRSVRSSMTADERRKFIRLFLPGIVLIVLTYMMLTVLRDIRDNFANELYTELGFGNQPSVFTLTEVPVSLIVLFSMSMLIFIKSNIRAFMINHYIVVAGYLLTLLFTMLFRYHYIQPVPWMIATGTGLYVSYVPFNALYFERMIASDKITANVGFIMYVSDSFGYLGSVAVLFIKQFSGVALSWTDFFIDAILIVSTVGIAGTMLASMYFRKKYNTLYSPFHPLYAA